MKGLFPLLGKKTDAQEEYYENSTQKWLPLADIKNGIIVLKDGRYIKLIEVLPVNFYLKSEVEQENIIFYFASCVKVVYRALLHFQVQFNNAVCRDICWNK